ncbi:MAG: FAD binding domain-containing protein, partial [Acidimicrobiales bacterium]
MPSVVSYHRPATIDEAAILLAAGNARAVGGGTVAVPDARTSRDLGVQVVDLQALGLDAIGVADENSGADGRLRVGAMAPIGRLIDDERVPALLRDLARRELPSTLRYQATVGGLVAGRWHESALLAGLLVHDAVVELHGAESLALTDYLAAGPGPHLI